MTSPSVPRAARDRAVATPIPPGRRVRGAALLAVALSVACATPAFDPETWDPDDFEVWVSPALPTVAGPIVVRGAWPPGEDDPRSSFRFETQDGRVLTPWMRRPVPLDAFDAPAHFVITPSGKVAVFDNGQPLLDDVGEPPAAGWYRADRDGLQLLPEFELWQLHDGSVVGVRAEWDGEPPGPEEGWLMRIDATGYGRRAPEALSSLALVAFDDALRAIGEPLVLDPRAPEPWNIAGSFVRVSGPDGTPRFFDGRLRPLDLERPVELTFGRLRMLLRLDDEGALHLYSSAGTEDVVEGRWDDVRVVDGLGRRALALGRAGSPLSDLVVFDDFTPRVALRDVASVEGFLLDVPEVLRGRPGFDATWQGLLVERVVDGRPRWEVHEPSRVAEGAGTEASDRASGLAAVERMLAVQADEAQAALDVRLQRAYGPLATAGEITGVYVDALREGDLGAAGFAVETLRSVLAQVEIPGDLPQADDVRRRISLEYVTVVDWELRRPDRTLESLVAVMPSASQNAGFASRYWALLEGEILARDEAPSRAVWDDLYRYASNSVSEDARAKIMWWYDKVNQRETRAEYDAALARGDLAYADSISAGLGEDGWIDHLLHAEYVTMRADLLAIAMQRRPDRFEELNGRLRTELDDRYARQRAAFEAQSRADDAASAAQSAAWAASSRRWEQIQALAAKGLETWGY